MDAYNLVTFCWLRLALRLFYVNNLRLVQFFWFVWDRNTVIKT